MVGEKTEYLSNENIDDINNIKKVIADNIINDIRVNDFSNVIFSYWFRII